MIPNISNSSISISNSSSGSRNSSSDISHHWDFIEVWDFSQGLSPGTTQLLCIVVVVIAVVAVVVAVVVTVVFVIFHRFGT